MKFYILVIVKFKSVCFFLHFISFSLHSFVNLWLNTLSLARREKKTYFAFEISLQRLVNPIVLLEIWWIFSKKPRKNRAKIDVPVNNGFYRIKVINTAISFFVMCVCWKKNELCNWTSYVCFISHLDANSFLSQAKRFLCENWCSKLSHAKCWMQINDSHMMDLLQQIDTNGRA